ncbi:MAG: N-acetyltransferase family protein [Vicinamibacterales bacterium]
MSEPTAAFAIAPATPTDLSLVLALIRELADYEQLSHEVQATEGMLGDALFGPEAVAHAIIARDAAGTPAGFALYFFNFSTFLGRPGLYLEDLFVRPAFRRRGLGRQLLAHLARIAVDRGCGRMEWSVLNWNALALGVYRAIGAVPMSEWTVQRLTSDALEALAARSR